MDLTMCAGNEIQYATLQISLFNIHRKYKYKIKANNS